MAPALRPLAVTDWQAVHDWAQREEACRFQSWGPNTPEQTLSFVQEAVAAWSHRPQTRFAFAVTVESRVVGTAELRLRGHRQGEISYAIHPDLWGQGFASAAAGQLLAAGFTEHGLHRIWGTCDPRNRASARVLAKIGMKYEGRLRENLWIRDGWRDSDLYAILESELPRTAHPLRPMC